MPESIRFENYELLRREDGSIFELGRGAMGVTYKAFDTDLHCNVALKVINPGILGSGDARERFLREARAAAQLRHPNIATAFRLGRAADDTHFYAMEFCEGPTLAQAVASRGALPVREAVHIAWQVSKALVLAEQQRLLHRDLKPANLILTQRSDEGMVVKVIDFGLAKSFADGAQSLAATSIGGFVGTAQFASPEQLEEKELDIRSDIYSLGSCLWFMLAARAPFEGSLARVMSQTLTAEPPWEMLAKLPEPVVSLVRRMLSKNRDDRQPNASALKKELEACLHMLASPETEKSDAYAPSSEAAKSDALPEKTATARLDGESFNSRFRMNHPAARDALGQGYRATDCTGGGESFSVHEFDPSLTRVPALRREIEARVAAAAAHPHPNLLAPVAFTSGAHGVLIASPWTEGFTLLDLLRERGALAPSEVLRLIEPLAHAADHAVERKITGLDLSKGQIVAHFPGGLPSDARGRVFATPVEQWPEFEIKAGALSLGELTSESSASLASMATMAPANACPAALAPVQALASLACELLGAPATGTYAPIARLSEKANAVLRRAISEAGAFSTATAFAEALRKTIGAGGTSAAPFRPKKRELAVPSPGTSDTTPPAKSRVFAVLVLLAVAGLAAGYWFGIHRPREREREKREANAAGAKNESPARAHATAKSPLTETVASALPSKETANQREEKAAKAGHPEVEKDTVKTAPSDEPSAKSRLTAEERFNRIRALLRKAFSDDTYSTALSCLEARSTAGDLRGLKEDLGLGSDLAYHIGYSAGPSLATVAGAQAESGNLDGAMKTAEGILDKDLKVSALTEVAVVQARQGNQADSLGTLRRAKAIAEGISDMSLKVSALTKVAVVQARQGNQADSLGTLRRAKAIADNIDDVEHKAALFGDIATAYAGIGEFDEGKRLYAEADMLPNTGEGMYAFNSMWELLALKHFEQKEFGDAYQAMDKLKNHNHSIEVEKALGWRKVAEALIRKNRLDLAEKVVSEYIPRHVKQDDSMGSQPDIVVLTEIAMAYASIGDRKGFLQAIDQAVMSARTCSDTSIQHTDPFCPRVDALMDIARTCARAGDEKRFENIMSEAFTVLERLPGKDFRPLALEAIACAQANAGYIDQARETMKRITDETARPIVNRAIAGGRAEDAPEARYQGALKNVTEAIVRRLAEEGRFEEAEAIIPHRSDEARSYYRLIIRGLLLDGARPPAWTVASTKVSELQPTGSTASATGGTNANKAAAAIAPLPLQKIELVYTLRAFSNSAIPGVIHDFAPRGMSEEEYRQALTDAGTYHASITSLPNTRFQSEKAKDALRLQGIILTVEELPDRAPAYLGNKSRVLYYALSSRAKATELAALLSKETGLRFTADQGATPPSCASHRFAIHCVPDPSPPPQDKLLKSGAAGKGENGIVMKPAAPAQPKGAAAKSPATIRAAPPKESPGKPGDSLRDRTRAFDKL